METTNIRISIAILGWGNDEMHGVTSLMDAFTGKEEGRCKWCKTPTTTEYTYLISTPYFDDEEVSDKIDTCIKTYYDAIFGKKEITAWACDVEKIEHEPIELQMKWDYDNRTKTFIFGSSNNGGGVYQESDAWYGNSVVDGDIIMFGPKYTNKEEIQKEIEENFFKRSKDI